MGALCCCPKEKPTKKTSLDEKLQRKIADMKRYKLVEKVKSIDSVFMMFPMFKENLKALRGMFEKYDLDSNGSIELNELKSFLHQLQLPLEEQDIENIFKYCDIDGSKGIQFNEFIVLLCLIHLLTEPAPPPSEAGLAQIGETFDKMVLVFLFFDQNGNGKLNKNDIFRALNETNPKERSPAHVVKKRFEEIDWDKNGQVTLREFLFGFIKWVGIDVDE